MLPPPQIPTGAMICNDCGNVRIFALGVLDLLPKDKGSEKKKGGDNE